MTKQYIAGDRIGWGDLITTLIQHHTIAPTERGPSWHEQEQIIRATLNHITEEVHDLPGVITILEPPTYPLPRPPIRPTDSIPPHPTLKPGKKAK